jgi:hypothetical protein
MSVALHQLTGNLVILVLPLVKSIKSGINNMKVSISLPDELVRYCGDRVENLDRLVEVYCKRGATTRTAGNGRSCLLRG